MKQTFTLLCFLLFAAASPGSQVRVEGRITDSTGAPVAGALVAAVPADSVPRLLEIPLAHTDATGLFTLTCMAGRVGFTATAAGRKPHFQVLDLKPGRAVPRLEVRLEEGGVRVHGLLSDARGRGPAGARVAFFRVSGEYAGDLFFAEIRGGEFETWLEPGPYFVQAEAAGLSSRITTADINEALDLKRLVLASLPVPAGSRVRKWIRSQAVPLSGVDAGCGSGDLRTLKDIVGAASVVALGEATHGTSEFFRLKHRLLEFLVEDLGFSVFAIEASFADAWAVNDYVLLGQGDPAQALAGLGYWTCNFEEVLAMIRWMRRYNEDPSHARKVKFYGFDMNSPLTACAQAKAWFEREDPAGAALFVFEQMDLFSAAKAPALKTFAEQLIARLDARREALSNVEAATALERQRRNLVILTQWAERLSDPFGGSGVRDKAMAANVLWIRSREPGAKLVLWAHNSHVSFQEEGMGSSDFMGKHLRRALGPAYLAVGLAFREGGFIAWDAGPESKGCVPFSVEPHPRGTLDEALASAGMPILALDLRRLPKAGPEREWFGQPQGTWHIGSGFSVPDRDYFVDSIAVTSAYDALLFVARTTAARLDPGAAGGGGTRTATGGRTGDAALPAYVIPAPKNLGFEDGREGERPPVWLVHMDPAFSKAECVAENPNEGSRALRISYRRNPQRPFLNNAMQSIDAEPYRGKSIRLAGWIRTDGQPGNRGGLFVRADLDVYSRRVGFFDNMQDRGVSSSSWTRAVIEGVVDAGAKILNFGLWVEGEGTFWFDGLALEIIRQRP